ncbi:hypothetical protein BN000_05884 [Mycobacterium europaeum]|uniref:Uncharacterized protein n=1 Tax=Mycobacterium europaeum TaxID=761804 RepID=A0A0U1DVM4_9MYCO|nr:hypothetical protein BN000_05884 [Mycobacterium europaeum]
MRRPVVPFGVRVARPAIERFIDDHASIELGMVVAVNARQAQRYGE